jgi:hypothetical protein
MWLRQINSLFVLSTNLNLPQVIFQAILLILFSSLLSLVYYFTGNSLSNRSRLAATFPLMSLTTMLIISIIKVSLALSLGLVGALSIVRFRSAIKDPEELVYIFLAITLGLGFGAEQVFLTTLIFAVILGVILAQALLRGRLGKLFSDKDSVHLELVFTEPQKLPAVLKLLDQHCRLIKLLRLSQKKHQTMLFLVKPKSTESLESLRQAFLKLDTKLQFTLFQYQPLV